MSLANAVFERRNFAAQRGARVDLVEESGEQLCRRRNEVQLGVRPRARSAAGRAIGVDQTRRLGGYAGERCRQNDVTRFGIHEHGTPLAHHAIDELFAERDHAITARIADVCGCSEPIRCIATEYDDARRAEHVAGNLARG